MSKPKTAYGALAQVCREMKKYPLNYYQDEFALKRTTTEYGRTIPEELNKPANECGTSFCRAGFLVNVVDGFKPRRITNHDFSWYCRAEKILGVKPLNWDDGSGFDADISLLFDAGQVEGTPGTKSYVNRGIKGVQAFMKKHRARLLARKLPKRS